MLWKRRRIAQTQQALDAPVTTSTTTRLAMLLGRLEDLGRCARKAAAVGVVWEYDMIYIYILYIYYMCRERERD